jgi:integrase
VVPVFYPEVRDMLASLPTRFGGGVVFVRENGKPLPPQPYRTEWIKRADALGIPNFTLHDLKRTAITYLGLYGVPPIYVEHASDHSGPQIAAIYKDMTAERMTMTLDRYFNPATGLVERIGAAAQVQVTA